MIKIHHNTFYLIDELAIRIRGQPLRTAEIFNNCFSHASIGKAVEQVHGKGNVNVYQNKIGGCSATKSMY